jgi:hypothetical protein
MLRPARICWDLLEVGSTLLQSAELSALEISSFTTSFLTSTQLPRRHQLCNRSKNAQSSEFGSPKLCPKLHQLMCDDGTHSAVEVPIPSCFRPPSSRLSRHKRPSIPVSRARPFDLRCLYSAFLLLWTTSKLSRRHLILIARVATTTCATRRVPEP